MIGDNAKEEHMIEDVNIKLQNIENWNMNYDAKMKKFRNLKMKFTV